MGEMAYSAPDNRPMNPRAVPVQPAAPGMPWRRRLIGRWWRRQTPARQDRFATLAPLVSVLLFLAAIAACLLALVALLS